MRPNDDDGLVWKQKELSMTGIPETLGTPTA